MRRTTFAALGMAVLMVSAFAQQKRLTLDDIYGAGGDNRFNGNPSAAPASLENLWVDDTHFLWPDDSRWLLVEAVSGKKERLFDPASLVAALTTLGVNVEESNFAARNRPANFNSRHDGFVVTVGDDLFYYDIPRRAAVRLTRSTNPKEEPMFSPDGNAVAFVSDNNLYVTRIDKPAVSALTTDGNADVLNGKLDWVYSEELYGRGHHQAYWWSPDSSRIAFLQLNETAVPSYTLVDDIAYHPGIETWKYPKAGDPNPVARLGIVSIAGGPATWADTSKYSDILIVNAGWTPDGRSVSFQVQDRRQSWLDFNVATAANGKTTTLFRETSSTWVERWEDSSADPTWLRDGSFLWLSERTGWRHLYRYNADGTLLKQVTTGQWEIRSIDGVNEADDLIYFSGTARSAIGSDLYRIKFDGSGLQQLTSAPGVHHAIFSPHATMYLDSSSNAITPPQVSLHRASGGPIRVVEPNPVPALKEYRLSAPEFLQVKARDGFVMEAMMLKPSAFDRSKKYPVIQHVYGGPHLQQVTHSWRGLDYMYEQLLAERGVLVWACDNRTASGKGAVSVWPLFRNFGELELRDIEDCLAWLKQQPYVDSSRIGLFGYSYGGYLTTYALTHPSSFSMGIAGGALTDWRDYDTIFAERYLGLPEENAEGYRKSSPRFSAGRLHGQLLLTHGEMDDNVHLQNLMQFAYELQNAGKQFEMMIYPKSGHGVTDPQLNRHERQLMLDFTLRTLKP